MRDTRVSPSTSSELSPLQKAALELTDSMTRNVKVPDSVFDRVKAEFAKQVQDDSEQVNRKMAETTLTIAVYNMVSRFLVAFDVDDRANLECPRPHGAEHVVDPPHLDLHSPASGASSSAGRGLVQLPDGQQLSTRVHFHSMSAPWIVLVNSLMTNLTMWDWVLPELTTRFNVLSYDQRGHGASSVPAEPCTIAQLSDDVAFLLDGIGVKKAYAVIGVSQGGATALSFALRHPDRYERLVACDTQPASPEANRKAWDERIELARAEGMSALAQVTVPRWYGPGSAASPSCRQTTEAMVRDTQLEGFIAGARALQDYNLIDAGIVDGFAKGGKKHLLVAGQADGKLPETLCAFADKLAGAGADASFVAIPDAGHLPMCDNPQAWLEPVLEFLK